MNRRKVQEIREHWQQFRQQVAQTGDMLRGRSMPELTKELFGLYEETGNRLIYEDEYFERRRFLAVFGLLSIWYEREEDLRKLEEVIREICLEETWALPAHVNRQEKDWQRTVDLFACETGQALAQIVTELSGKLDAALAGQVRSLVVHRLLDAYMEKEKGAWRWESMYNNWVAVCAGCLGSMALCLLQEEPLRQKQIVDRVISTLPDYLEGMCDDGTCPEGMSYFTYGMVYYTGFAEQLKAHTKGGVCLLEQEKVRRIAQFQQKCYLTGGITVSFSDGNSHDRFRLGLTCCLAEMIDGVEISPVSAAMGFEDDHCYRFMANYQDDCWVRRYLEKLEKGAALDAGEEQEQAAWFALLPDAQWAVWKNDGLDMAVKGGHNGEPHNHNDVGSLMFAADGEIFLSDLGCGEYDQKYFADETRYTILCNRSFGHSVPILNGQEQKTGREYGAACFTGDADGRVTLEYGGAYGSSRRLERIVTFRKGARDFMLEDRASDMGQQDWLEENFVTQTEPVITGCRICIPGKKGTLTLTAEGAQDVVVHKDVFVNHRGKDEDVWLIRFRVTRQGTMAVCRIHGEYEAIETIKTIKTIEKIKMTEKGEAGCRQ